MGDVIGYLIYDGVDSREFGVYVGSTGIHISPERDVEEVEIPGRNGTLTIDHGRFRNVEIKYPAFILSDYAEKFEAFKAFLCSHHTYAKLEDSFTPGYYRLAKFNAILEPTPTAYDIAGSFTLPFNCDPRKFFKGGTSETLRLEYNPDPVYDPSHDYLGTIDRIKNPAYFDTKPCIDIYVRDLCGMKMSAHFKFINLDNPNEYYEADLETLSCTATEWGAARYRIDTEVGALYFAANISDMTAPSYDRPEMPDEQDLQFVGISPTYYNLKLFKNTKVEILFDFTLIEIGALSSVSDMIVVINPKWWTV